jgi:DNA polymerase-1
MPRLYGGVRLLGDGPSLKNIEKLDHGSLPMFNYMIQRGMQVDLDHFARMDKTLTEGMDRLTEEVRKDTGYYCNLDSGDQVADLLFKKLGMKQARIKFTKSGDRESVEDEVLTAIQHESPIIGKIQEFKELSKLRGTYVRPMPKLARRTKFGVWRMFPNMGINRVPSGRPNCKAPNLLAMPSRTDLGRQIRDGFITDEGWTYVSVDESQIEVRVAAHSSEDAGLVHIYETDQDIYSDFAVSSFKIKDTRFRDTGGWHYPGVDKMLHRYPSKTCILAAIYDVSPPGLLEQMPVICGNCFLAATKHTCDRFVPLWNEDKCAQILNSFYLKYPGILTDRKRNHQRARRYGYIWDMWGRLLHVGAVKSVHKWVVSSALREVGNFPYQGGANGTIKLTMAAVQDDLEEMSMLGDVCHPLLMIHDELLFEARKDVAEELAEHVKSRFETCAPLRVPIKAGAAMADTWGSIPK